MKKKIISLGTSMDNITINTDSQTVTIEIPKDYPQSANANISEEE